MQITNQEARELRRETSLLGQSNNETSFGNYLPEEMSMEQAQQEGLSVITNLQSLAFHHNKQIYITPPSWEDDESYN